ncbi:major facilitator superfamily domain-containing protein [Xylariales sp. PMI_506]|nr:major facilitator superfamily domain-containing protein [Xylariales sp. PMI_506]
MEPTETTTTGPAFEATPLLWGTASAPAAPATPRVAASLRAAASAHWRRWSYMYWCCLYVFLVDFGPFMAEGARVRVLELGICREHFLDADPGAIGGDGSVPEKLCKIPAVQGELARMRGFLGLLQGLPVWYKLALLLAVPYGILADRKGRRLVATICLVGLSLSEGFLLAVLYFHEIFPLRAVYAAPAFLVIGGGSAVISSTVLAIIAAASLEEDRTQAFLLVGVMMLVSEFLSAPVGSFLMDRIGPYGTFLMAFPFSLAGAFVLFLMPKDEHFKIRSDAETDESEQSTFFATNSIPQAKIGHMAELSRFIREDVWSLFQRPAVFIGVGCLATQKLTRPMLDMFLQYMSAKFLWPLSRAMYIISLQAAIQIMLFVFIVPLVYRWLLKRRNDSPTNANLALARLCICFMAIGALGMALAPVAPAFIASVVVYTCGTSYSEAMRAFLTGLIDKSHITTMYTIMALTGGLAALSASPVLGLALSAGIHRGGLAMGLPFFITTGIFVVTGIGLLVIRAEAMPREEDEIE